MGTIHIESNKEDIAPLVLMPGDPLRAKYIADNFLNDVKVVNNVRNMTAYTGLYKDKRITVFPSGMGIPSMGIYAYELFTYYDVQRIIRIGTSGSMNPSIKIMDIVLSKGSVTKSYFSRLFDNKNIEYATADDKLNKIIIDKAKELNLNCKLGKTITTDVFDPYCEDPNLFICNFKKDNYFASEMESFALFYLANKYKRETACLLTIVDSKYEDIEVSSTEREKSLNDMITLALESI